MNEPRIVTPQEAREWLDLRAANWPVFSLVTAPDLACTVLTEPDRIRAAERAAVVKALRGAADRICHDPEDALLVAERANAIENGADL